MNKKVFFPILAVFLLVAGRVSAETVIKAEVDKTSLSINDILTYKIIITSSEKKLPQPEVPGFDGFNVLSQAQSSTISMIKSEIKTILVYAFILAPESTGKFKIEPAVIKVNNQAISSLAFEIEVTQGPAAPEAGEGPSGKDNIPEDTTPESLPELSDQSQITL